MPDVFILTETWLTPWDNPIIRGYKSYHTFRPLGRSGGVSIFVKSSLQSNSVPVLSFANSTIESCSVEIKSTPPVVVTGIYRPHSDTVTNFTSSLDNLLNNRFLTNKTSVILGDMNINLLTDNHDVNLFCGLLRSLHYLLVISLPNSIPPNNNHASSLLRFGPG